MPPASDAAALGAAASTRTTPSNDLLARIASLDEVVFLVTTVMGLTGLWRAILAGTGAMVLVPANAMRLLSTGKR